MQITFLGTGTSHGVPMIDCLLRDYAICPHRICERALSEPRYRRTRASILVQTSSASLLFDTSQDFREQMLRERVTRLDAVIYTHGHADHIYGLADIRSYSAQQHGAIPIYGSEETLAILRGAFDYIFAPPEFVGGGIPMLEPHLMPAEGLTLGGLPILPVPVEHGTLHGCLGYRLGDVAYIPDAKRIPESSLALLEGLDLLILNCLRHRPHVTHLSLDESLAYVERLKPRRALFTHLSHDIDYQLVEPTLPDHVRFAYDGQRVEV